MPRYFTMRGYGFHGAGAGTATGSRSSTRWRRSSDCPVPAGIAALGLERFTDECRALVLRYAAEWERIVTRLGRWVDFAHAYRTMDRWYMESVLWAFQRLHERGLIVRRAQGRALLLPMPDAAVELRGEARRRISAAHRPVRAREVPASRAIRRRRSSPGRPRRGPCRRTSRSPCIRTSSYVRVRVAGERSGSPPTAGLAAPQLSPPCVKCKGGTWSAWCYEPVFPHFVGTSQARSWYCRRFRLR